MSGRGVLNFLFGLLVVGLLVAVGVGIYQAGFSQGLVAGNVPEGQAVPVPVHGYGYGWGWGWGFGFLGFLFPLLFLFLIFGLVRAAFGRGRGWGPGWNGYGKWGYGYGPRSGDPDAWREERDRRIAEMHRQLHEAEGQPGAGDQGTGGKGPGDPGGGAAR